MGFTAASVTAIQAQIATFPLSKLMQILEAIDVVGGAVVNSSGTVTVGGRALTNAQYYQIYEMCSSMF